MQRDEFYRPSDIDELRMENELLAYENAFLKGRLAEVHRTGQGGTVLGRGLSRQSLAPAWQRVKQGRLGPVAVRLRQSAVGRRLESRLLSS